MTSNPTQVANSGQNHPSEDRQVSRTIAILDAHRIMAVSTIRGDGWPQTTIVGYANDGLTLYFMILRSSQKFANIQRDNRVSIAIGQEPVDLRQAKAVFAGATAEEVTDPAERKDAWNLLKERHPNLDAFELPDNENAAVMRASCRYISIVDYTKGVGHSEEFAAEDGPAR